MEPTGFDFAEVILQLKAGRRVARHGWNGEGMFIFLVDGSTFTVSRPPLNVFYEEGTEVQYRPHIDMKAADGSIGVWTASQTDMLSEDWYIVLDESVSENIEDSE